jgi:hypothetical protein
LNGWIGVTSASPQYARMRKNPDLTRLIAGMSRPWVRAAPRATVVQKLSASFGVTRTSSTDGKSSTYVDQFKKFVSGRISTGSGAGGVFERLERWLARSACNCGP